MDTARVGGVDDVGDHIEDGDCVPTCVFTVLDMDIAKDRSVEVVVVKMKNCHFETSLVTKNYLLQSVLFSSKHRKNCECCPGHYPSTSVY